ncbi:trifunctional serine/threonine-protein kinase/ATP-binding protein/sensor histidine kinase [Pararobbsia alpina]|uniref:histidine kinase n=1 Tax=Pararobbsia alpina TaxID=621374 RepID=A0A6S7CS08_9BURK|nr:AAA family ATPase [Pararobbsia alpina]CAB3796427.1 Adaptive-response sensory-kinase SasA [Pararobbsia alpina]
MAIANCQIYDRICATAGSDLYRARRLTDGMPVLLKLASEHDDAAQSARLKREYVLLQSLNVEGIAKPLALADGRGGSAVVLEDFTGESLEVVLGREPRMDLALCLRIGRNLSDALTAIDAAQVIHRDIRPANILVDPATGRVLLADFSMATAREASTVSSEDVAVPAGDWAYVSPEQTGRMNRPVDYRTDGYSMGVLLYRMLTGQLPFQANDPLEWMHCHIARMPTPPREIVPEVPQPVSDIVMKLLAKLPEDRYQSAQGLKVDLDRCLAQWQASGRVEPFALGKEDIPERFQVPRRLYGRGPEAERLLGAFERMASTGQAALATVSGYSGIGKSSLVDALRKPIVAKHGYFIAGKFDQYQRDIPYATLTQAFRELVQQLLAESEARVAGWRQQIQAAVGANGQLIVDVLPQVELIIGPQPPVPVLPPTEAQNRLRLVFRQFVTAFTSEDHPLVLFLDDLQWIDAASLALVEHLLTHSDIRHLLLIGAYRDNEVSAAHPLMTSLETIRHSGTSVTDLQLVAPSVTHLNQLVADALHAPPASCEPLTRLVFERTEGNPFFFIQFLDALHRNGLLRHDAQQRAWQWDLNEIKAMDFADNVVDLMVGKLRQLPVPAQEALQLAACLGNTFKLRQLTLVSEHAAIQVRRNSSKAEAEQGLAAAVRESLIMRSDGSGKFLHDRIQQAAYSLTPEAQRAEVHLQIGRVFLANMTADELAEHVFDVANQFNRGGGLLIERDEKVQVAALDLRAGRRAKASAAYASARPYLAAGMALLDETYWASQYELMFSLWLECAECEFLTGRFDQAEQLIEELLQRCASKLDQAVVYHLEVQLHIVKSENPQAVNSALACLRLFGIDLPAHPTQEQVQAEYETVWRNLAGRPIESLIDLPLMTDPELQAAMRLLSALFGAAYYTDFHLLRLHLCRMVNISLQHGTTGDLAEREARIRRLVDANIVGIFIWDLAGQILEANDAFLRIVGYDREDLMSGRMRWTDLTPPKWLDRDNQRILELKMTGTLQPFEKEFSRKDGSRAPVLIGVAMFEAGANQGVAFVLDLTERKRAEAEARESERRYREVQMELAHSNRAATMGQLTASIAHEVQQPIAAAAADASAALRWLRTNPPNLEEVRQSLDRIVNETMRAGGIVNGIRGLIKKAPPRKDKVDINEAVREVIELTQGEAAKNRVSVQTLLGDGLPFVRGDRVQLQQVMLNLILNAVEAMSTTSMAPRDLLISTTADSSDGVSIAVRDSGPGLSPEEVKRVFDPFYTTKAHGLGMGLSICRSIVEAHGGRLWASANAPRGADFQLVLPNGEVEHAPFSENDGQPVA